MRSTVALALVATLTGTVPAADPDRTADQIFEPKLPNSFVFSDPAVWKVGKGTDGTSYLELAYDKKTYKSPYNPKHRSPIHIALIANMQFTDFTLLCELQSTTEPYGHQDMCIYFGFTDPQKFYYIHIARAADPNAHNVFIVNDAPRKNFAKETTKGVEWKKETWHKVRVRRDTQKGTIEVFFDDMTKPIMTAEDKTFGAGYIGFGSFDDTGRVRNISIAGKRGAEDKKADFFKPLGKDK